jgi:glycosyltransferase involved in cell wall biosynthesis
VKIGIDGRRGPGSGVGRVTQNLAAMLQRHRADYQVILYLDKERPPLDLYGIDGRHCPIPYHSAGDYFEFPEILKEDGIELFIAPQYYVSPWVECPTIKFVHDLWPLLHPEWVPGPRDFSARYGEQRLREALHFLEQSVSPRQGWPPLAANQFIASYLGQCRNPVAAYNAVMFLLAFQNAALIAVPSQHTLCEVRAVFPEYLHKVRLVPNAVHPLFRPSPERRGHFLLHVSNWEPRKNLETLLEAFGLLRRQGLDLELFLVGNAGPSAYTRRIERLIRSHPHSGAISRLGLIDDAVLLRLYRQACAFVCPSLYEGFGIPVLEAMACGAPVVCSCATALPEVCGKGALFFDPRRPAELCDALSAVLRDEALRARLVARGFANAGRFSQAAIQAKLLAVIESCA